MKNRISLSQPFLLFLGHVFFISEQREQSRKSRSLVSVHPETINPGHSADWNTRVGCFFSILCNAKSHRCHKLHRIRVKNFTARDCKKHFGDSERVPLKEKVFSLGKIHFSKGSHCGSDYEILNISLFSTHAIL